MKIITEIEELPAAGCCLAMGYFDGIHIGHRAVIEAAVSYARERGLAPALFTFTLPDKQGLKGDRLMTEADKRRRVAELGVEYFLEPDFDSIRNYSPEAFVQEILHGVWHARGVFCGPNFTFGQRAAGTVDTLAELAKPLGLHVGLVPLAQYRGEAVSSTRIRAALAAGSLEEANAMLGEAWSVDFPVVHGKGLGRTIGMPTINQAWPSGFQYPRFGFYVSRILLNGRWYPAATGVGGRPTVAAEGSAVTCETYVPGFSGSVYGQTPRLEFHRFLRPTEKFPSVDALAKAVLAAGGEAKRYFS